MNQQHATAGAAVSTSGAGSGYRDPLLARPVAERAGWQEIDARPNMTAEAASTPEGLHMTSDTRQDPLAQLSAQGVAVWLDDLSRELLASGETARTHSWPSACTADRRCRRHLVPRSARRRPTR